METKYIILVVLALMMGTGSSDLSKDREKCADQLVGLATCLPYVGGDAKTPTIDCCTGLKEVLSKSKECLCILVKDRNDPSLGLKINATLALGLPDKCRVPANISDCPALLHLAPNSPDAKVFEDFTRTAKGSNATSTPANQVKANPSGEASSADVKNEGVRRIRCNGGTQMTLLMLLATMLSLHTLANNVI